MAILVTDMELEERLLAERRASGGDRYDEVWEGTYVMAPMADNEHQDVQSDLVSIFKTALGGPGRGQRGRVHAGANVSDREIEWNENYRCPDVAVFLPENAAEDRGTHWLGGPDLAVEIMSRADRSRQKFDFYAAVGVREFLLIDRGPWSLELYRLTDGEFRSVARAVPDTTAVAESAVLPLTFRLLPGSPRPSIEVVDRDTHQRWVI